jgi:hypothetical protein
VYLCKRGKKRKKYAVEGEIKRESEDRKRERVKWETKRERERKRDRDKFFFEKKLL